MKKLVLALATLATFTAPAFAADIAARPYTKAPAPVAYVPSWTGFWISGGAGYALMDAEHSVTSPVAPFPSFGVGNDTGGRGWLGKLGAGADYQFAGPWGNWVVGVFGDYTFSDIKGNASFNCPVGCFGPSVTGQLKNDWSWAVGGRIGFVALPGLLTYFNGGYTQAHFKQVNYLDSTLGTLTGLVGDSRTRDGWFLGGGTEYAITQIPGLFWKNEVRFSEFDNKTTANICVVAGPCGAAGTVHSLSSGKVFEQAATTELVYRFNWAR